MKCSKCNRSPDHEVGGIKYCKYHYWKIKPESCWDWKGYKILHPVRISAWRKADPAFDKLLKEQGL